MCFKIKVNRVERCLEINGVEFSTYCKAFSYTKNKMSFDIFLTVNCFLFLFLIKLIKYLYSDEIPYILNANANHYF